MPTLTINGAALYYEILGRRRGAKHSAEIPILLIHGSTNDGREDWGTIGPILARKRPVIVPDCRGHGRSSNPNSSYSFCEMADDLAALLHALGYDHADIIGHSNGGNVALVMLLEHPEVVRSAVIQAANAYVDDFLRRREPGIFDPERIARESPDWLKAMKRIHDPHQGEGYWRKLLALTLRETITQPNYTAQDLAKVKRPALVIQGADDPVNAPSRHAQFIARHIPFAELWTPQGISHNVHHELPTEWAAKVEDFFERRGDPASDALYRLERANFADRRETVFELRADPPAAGEPGKRRLRGRVLYAGQLLAAEHALEKAGFEAQPQEIGVLLDEKAPWALVTRPLSDLREKPTRSSERLSQVLLGEAVRVLGEDGEWSWVRVEHDGYLGWVLSAALHGCDAAQVREYHSAGESRVIAELLPAWNHPREVGDLSSARIKLPFGVRVAARPVEDDLAEIAFPDGRLFWAAASGILPAEQAPKPDAAGVEAALRLMRRFVGVPYLWGGRTPFGYDCSGLAGTFWAWLGVVLKRDADQQSRQGVAVEGPAQPGDLLFFGEQDSGRTENVNHVAISLGGERVLHATGALGGTVYNSLNPDHPEYRAWLRENFMGTRRYTAC